MGDLRSIPGLGRSPGKGKGYPLQYSDLENSMDYIVHGVAKNQTGASDFHFLHGYHSSLCIASGDFSMPPYGLSTPDWWVSLHCHERQWNRHAPGLSTNSGWSKSWRCRLYTGSCGLLYCRVLWVNPIRKIKIPLLGRKMKSYCNKNLPLKKLFLKKICSACIKASNYTHLERRMRQKKKKMHETANHIYSASCRKQRNAGCINRQGGPFLI